METLVARSYDAITNPNSEVFRVVEGQTPLTDAYTPYISIVIYLSVIFGLQKFMRDRKPMNIEKLVMAHNYFLSFISLILFLLLSEAIFPQWWRNSFFYCVCDIGLFEDHRLELFFYVNYLIKYYELIDTVFLVLKKKNLEFLHVYHHALTMLLCYTQLVGKTSVQWVPIIINLFVHVLMYYYFAIAAQKRTVWWKKYLTSLQITQFLIDLGCIYFCMITYWAHHDYWFAPKWMDFGDCNGHHFAAYFGAGLLSSYLFLFIDLYIKTYKTGTRGRPQPTTPTKKED